MLDTNVQANFHTAEIKFQIDISCFFKNSNKQTLALHFKCRPGTDRDVINIVKQRRKNTEPNNENVLLNIINLRYKLKILYFIR